MREIGITKAAGCRTEIRGDMLVVLDVPAESAVFDQQPGAYTAGPLPAEKPVRPPGADAPSGKAHWYDRPGMQAASPSSGAGDAAPAQTGSYSRTVTFANGAVLPLPYPQGNQQGTLIAGIQPGLIALGPFRIGKTEPGIGRISLAEIFAGQVVVDMAIGTQPGVLVGPSVYWETTQDPAPGTPFLVGKAGGQGYGPELPTDTDLYVNIHFHPGSGRSALLQVQAHDRA